MPYKTNTDLPANVAGVLPGRAQTIWRSAFNSALEKYGSEDRARRVAWDAVRKKYVKSDGGNWTRRNGTESRPVADPDAKATEFREAVSLEDARVDADGRMIHNVSMAGTASENGYEFSESAMRQLAEKAIGRKVFFNHHEAGRIFGDVRDLAAQIVRAEFDAQRRRVVGDLFCRVGENGDQMLRDAALNPGMTGFSFHHRSYLDPMTNRINEVDDVVRLDYVAEPATTNSMFEARRSDAPEKTPTEANQMEWEDISLAGLKTHRPDLYESVILEGKESRKTEVDGIQKKLDDATTELAGLREADRARKRKDEALEIFREAKLDPTDNKDLFEVVARQESPDDAKAIVAKVVEAREAAAVKSEPRNEGNDAGEKELTDDQARERIRKLASKK